MRTPSLLLMIGCIASGCQTADDLSPPASDPVAVTGPAASAIAGDMASRLAEKSGPAVSTIIRMENDGSDYGIALQAALKGWGYTISSDGKVAKDENVLALTYSAYRFDDQVLARLTTPSIALGRAYVVTPQGASPASPLSVMQSK